LSITIKDIAREAGMSPATVSLALKNNPAVKDETRRLIHELAKTMGYVPNPYAQRLVNGRSGIIGLVVPDITNMYYAALAECCDREVAAAGYLLSIAMSQGSPEREKQAVERMTADLSEAILLAPVNVPLKPDADDSYTESSPDPLESVGSPVIYTSALRRGSQLPYVISDLRGGMRTMTEHVVSSGRRRLLYLTGRRGVPVLDFREEGFREAAEGTQYDIIHLSDRSYESVRGYIADNIGSVRGYDAVISINDQMAAAVLNALLRAGVRVPQDIAVSGFDGVVSSEMAAVPITTIKQDIVRIAHEAVRLAVAAISGEQAEHEMVIPTSLIVRESTGK